MKHLNIVLLVVLFSYQSYSQTVPEGQIKVYDSYQPAKGSSTGLKNKFSINPLGILIGDYPIYYERMFGNTFSVELAAGLTYENYVGNLTTFGFFDVDSEFKRNFKVGSTYSISPKVYLNDDNFEGSYLCVVYRHRMYNSEAIQYQGQDISGVKEYNKLNSFTFNYGYVYDLGKGFLLDYYLGIGVRTQTVSQAHAEPSNVYPYTSSYVFTTEKTKKTLPSGMWGIKIAYSF
ncbi:hypothetical protein [Cytophaga aurantiaca]|uniref:hypothetical protein n=1 Tax=Cytophaga aurantiaca TaxID=29530 RepID=UPI000363D589|nr:hypothetical protein [Cytophaga aurantiaca]